MPRHTRNQNQSREQSQEQREIVTRSGRVSRPPTRYDTLEFLPGSNNRFTRGRPIDRSFSAKGGHSENYVHHYEPRVVEQPPIDDITLFSDDTKFIAEVLANTFTRRDYQCDDSDHEDPDWNPNDDDPDATESDDDMVDEVVEEGCESEIEVEEPDSDILEDADYESDGGNNDDMEDDSEDEDAVVRWKKWNERNQQKQLQVVGKRCRIYKQ
jgi:hypothetical protein